MSLNKFEKTILDLFEEPIISSKYISAENLEDPVTDFSGFMALLTEAELHKDKPLFQWALSLNDAGFGKLTSTLSKHLKNFTKTLELGSLESGFTVLEDVMPDLVAVREFKDVARGFPSCYVFNTTKQTLSPLSADNFIEAKSLIDGVPVKELKAHAFVLGTVFFDPNAGAIVEEITSDGSKLKKFNTYIPPKWEIDVEDSYPKEIPDKIDRLIKHLFPREDTREYFLNWVYHALTSRCQTMLMLIGGKGIGKGILLEDVLFNLFKAPGKSYATKVKNSFLDKEFNSEMKDRRLLLMDEMDIHDEKRADVIKNYFNDRVNMEDKGITSGLQNNWVSFCLTSNHYDKSSVTPDDRRYSILELGTTPLLEVMSTGELIQFKSDLEEVGSHMIAQFGQYITRHMKRNLNITPNTAWKKDAFYAASLSFRKDWEVIVLDIFSEMKFGERVSPDYIVKRCAKDTGFKELVMTHKTIGRFVDDFLLEGSIKIATSALETSWNSPSYTGGASSGGMSGGMTKKTRPKTFFRPTKEFYESFLYKQIVGKVSTENSINEDDDL
mgnify:CR=1 FL=1|jgi:hypothetical protein|tara:strand:+ start:2423 stop:4084 length:1662 start_codon:yes stop_codon:yes gene_type:complete